MTKPITFGVLGATSPVGAEVLKQLSERGIRVVAFSRCCSNSATDEVRWVSLADLDMERLQIELGAVQYWIAASPIWIIAQHFALMQRLSAVRVVCLSSTSQFTKVESASPYEEKVVQSLMAGERALEQWSTQTGVGWTVLRPTLIYGRGNDRNLSEIVKIIRRFRFFPLFGKANGLRQPIYVDDVACACIQAGFSDRALNKAYNISGAEKLPYREMVARVFVAMGLKPRLVNINLSLFNGALLFLRLIPRYKNWNADMVLRMNRDMVFEHEEAHRDFFFNPRQFVLTDIDVKSSGDQV